MKNFDQIFWAVVIAVGIWAAATPGRQFKFLPERYSIFNQLPPIVNVLMLLVVGLMLFKTK
jgi:hypothetical protein